MYRGAKYFAGLVVAAALFTACEGSTGPDDDDGGSASLVVTAANPVSGNGTLTGIAVISDTATINSVLHTVVRLTGLVGAIEHSMSVYFVATSGAIYSGNHTWGANIDGVPPVVAGTVACFAGGTPCNTTALSVNTGTKTITLTNLTMPAAFPAGAASTINGTIRW
ncbi:MAG: hypothetical protein ACKVS7_00050 [Gemmatimonadaceae bacterium]